MKLPRSTLSFDIGSNSVGSMWFDASVGSITVGTSVFPAGVDESDDQRGEPKNAKRRMTRRTRITLARRAERKRALRLRLITAGLLPIREEAFNALLASTDPWLLRRKGLDERLTPHEFGRALLHLAQRRGALGLHLSHDEGDEEKNPGKEDGEVKRAIGEVRAKMLKARLRTFGEFMVAAQANRVHPVLSEDRRPADERKGVREYRDAIRNKAGSYEHCADRALIRDEFNQLWNAQKKLGGPTAKLLTDELRLELDDPHRVRLDNDPSKPLEVRREYKQTFKEGGLLFGQRRQTWDLGTLGRCVLEPTERTAPHADMYASRFRVVETLNNLKVIERGKPPRPLSPAERKTIKGYLSGPLGVQKSGKHKGKPKHSVSVTDLRELMGWGKATKTTPFRFNIENDEDRVINTDWFNREIVHGSIGVEAWNAMPASLREGFNRAILGHNPEDEGAAEGLNAGVMRWGTLPANQAEALVAAWQHRPKLDAKRLNMSRKAVRNLLKLMDRDEPWKDCRSPTGYRWLTEIEARKMIAEDGEFLDETTRQPLDMHARRRYATGAKGATSRDRHYMAKHVLMKDGKVIIDQADPAKRPLAEPPPAPMISNPVVRKAIHEVRRHLVEYLTTLGRRPDQVYIELSREARVGKVDADRQLFRNRVRNRIRNEIIEEFDLAARTATQQRAAVDRVVLCVQQGGVCALCGNQRITTKLTTKNAAERTGCEVAHIIPRAVGGHNGLGNIVLAHTKCNQDMGRKTPRQYWSSTLKGGFDEGFRWVEGVYGDIERLRGSQIKAASGESLWACYFNGRDDKRKMEQFAKDVKDIQEMTHRQDAATKYAARQVMSYLADALYGGKGLPERSSGAGDPERERRIFASDGIWTSRLRREWGLFFEGYNRKLWMTS